MELQTKLQELGFTKKESAVYLAGIELGPTSASELARVSQIKRGTIYEIIESLKEKGFFSESKKGSKRLFVAADPNTLKIQQNDRERILENIFPLLRSISNVTANKPKVLYHDSIPEIRRTYKRLIDEQPTGSEVVDVASKVAELDLGPEWVGEWSKQRAKRKISNRFICDAQHPGVQKHIANSNTLLREVRFFPFETDMNIHLMVFDEKVYLTSYEGAPMGLLIEDIRIADSMRTLFEVMWQGLPKVGS